MGVYNEGFRVSVAPYPLIAIRNMAFHDILFVQKNAAWFSSYNLRFGHKFNEPEKIEDYNQHYVAMYEAAKRKFT